MDFSNSVSGSNESVKSASASSGAGADQSTARVEHNGSQYESWQQTPFVVHSGRELSPEQKRQLANYAEKPDGERVYGLLP
jgi:hypothetical protein